MSYFRMFEMLAADVPTPPTGKLSFFFDATSGEPSYKDDAGVVTSLAGAPGPGVPTGGTAGQALTKIDGTDFNTQWATVSLSPAGSNKYIQFNDSGAFGGDADFQYDKTTNVMSVVNINMAATGLMATAASTSANAGLRVPHGAAPSSPANGDVWTTTAGMYVRVNGVTVGPLAPAGAGSGDVVGPASSVDNTLPRFDSTTGKLLQTSGVLVSDLDEISGYKGNINTQTGTSYTLVAADSGKIVELSNAASIALTADPALPKGFCCTIVQVLAGVATIASTGSGTVVNRQSQFKTAGANAMCTVYVRSNSGSNAVFVFGGDTAA